MKKFHVISNIDKDPGLKEAAKVCEYLLSKGCECAISQISRTYGDVSVPNKVIDEIASDCEAVIVMGGDGTIIQIASPLAKKEIPLLGINLGNLGYLAEVNRDNIEPTLNRLIDDDFNLEERMMLHGHVYLNGEDTAADRALNDVVISREGSLRIIRFEIYVNDRLLNTYEGDGVIVSTPTGSTGYSMSAGGPIVEPDAKVILITPVAAHTLNSRPIVLSPDDRLKIVIANNRNNAPQKVQACFDGGSCYAMSAGDYVEIRCANRITRVIKMSKESFLDTLARKISS